MQVLATTLTLAEKSKPDAFSCLSFISNIRELWQKSPLAGRVDANWQESVFIVATAISVIGAVKAFFAGLTYYTVSFLVLAGISLIGRHFAQLYAIAEVYKGENEKFKQENEKLKASVQKITQEVDKFYKGNAIFGEHLNVLGKTSADNKETVESLKTNASAYMTQLAQHIATMGQEYATARQFVADIQSKEDNVMAQRARDLEAVYRQITKAQSELAATQAKYQAFIESMENDRAARQKEQAAFMAKMNEALEAQLSNISPEVRAQAEAFKNIAAGELEKFTVALAQRQPQLPQPTWYTGGEYRPGDVAIEVGNLVDPTAT